MTVTDSIASQRNPEGEAPRNAFPETRVRYEVLAFACTLSMITYIDRVCFGAAAPQLASELSLSGVADLKWAFTAFAIAYSVCEIPTGWRLRWPPTNISLCWPFPWLRCATIARSLQPGPPVRISAKGMLE